MLTDPMTPTTPQHLPATTPLAKLLAIARAAHAAYQDASPRLVSGRIVEDASAARIALDQAYDARHQADLLDPDHSDPAWADDALTHPHASLMAFYRDVRKPR